MRLSLYGCEEVERRAQQCSQRAGCALWPYSDTETPPVTFPALSVSVVKSQQLVSTGSKPHRIFYWCIICKWNQKLRPIRWSDDETDCYSLKTQWMKWAGAVQGPVSLSVCVFNKYWPVVCWHWKLWLLIAEGERVHLLFSVQTVIAARQVDWRARGSKSTWL